MDTTPKANNLRIGLLLPVADLYHRLWSDIDQILEGLGGKAAERLTAAGLHVVHSAAVSLPGQVAAACDRFAAEAVDLLVVALAPYCPSGVLSPALVASRLPVLLWPMQSILRLDPQEYDAEAIKLNHGVHGVQDLANVLGKTARSFGVIHGHHEQPQFITQLQQWTRAGRVIRAMQEAGPVQVGGHFEHMLDLQVGEDEFLRQMGIVPTVVSISDLAGQMAQVSPGDMAERVDRYRRTFEIGTEVSGSLLEKTARGEAALRAVLSRAGSRACGLNFLQLCNDARVADGLHVAASMLMRDRLGYAGEGDWVTAVLLFAVQQGFGVASFSEIFSIGYADDRLVLKHWGEGNFAMARARPRLLASRFTDRHRAEFAIVDFEFEPGPATLVNLNSTPEGRGRLISIGGEIVEDHLPKIDGPRGIFMPAGGDVNDLLTRYAYLGGSHHMALIPGTPVEVLEKVCRLAGWSYHRL